MGRPKSYDRTEALRRAMDLFWRKGYEGAHLQELVAVAGINRFSLYGEFGGKAGLFRAALDLYLADLADLEERLAAEPLGLDNVLAYFRAQTRDRFVHGCLAVNTLAQKHVVPDGAMERVSELLSALERLLRRNLAAALAAGEVPAEIDAGGLAKLALALDIGLLGYEIHSPSRSARAQVVRTLERLLRPRST